VRVRRAVWRVAWCVGALIGAVGCGSAEKLDALEVKVLYPLGGKGDDSISDNLFAGVVFAQVGAGFDLEEVEPETIEEAEAAFDAWVADGGPRRLIIAGASSYADFVAARDCDFRESFVLQLDQALPTCPRLRSVTYRTYAAAFLGGVAAVSPVVSPDGTAAIVAGTDIPPVRELVDGFTDGVAHAGGTVIHTEFVSDDPAIGFTDPEAAEALANEILEDTPVIFAPAGGSAEGVARALETRVGDDPDASAFFIGADVDQTPFHAEITVASVLKRFDLTVRDAILDAVVGSFLGGDVRVGFDDRYTELALSPGGALLPADAACIDDCETQDDLEGCLAECTTLEEVVDGARDAARAAGARYAEGAR